MSIQIYILSKLMDENNYPYKLKKQLSEPIPFDKMGNLTESKLYYHFESLTKQGFIEPVEVIKEMHRPDKQVFAITEKGRKKLPMLIYQVFEKAQALSEMIVGLAFIQFVDRAKVISILEEKIAKARENKLYLNDIYTQINATGSAKELIHFYEGYFNNRIDLELNWQEDLLEKIKTHII